MKKLLFAIIIALSLQAKADIIVTNLSTISVSAPQTVTTTRLIPVKDVKVVWTTFVISYAPPAYTQATYSVTYVLQDLTTKKEIPGSRGTRKMSESEVVAFATTKGIDFTGFGQGIGYLLNEYLKTLLAK